VGESAARARARRARCSDRLRSLWAGGPRSGSRRRLRRSD